MSVKAQFVLAEGWTSALIDLAGGGTHALGFSHVDIVLPTGELYGARSDSIGGKPPGVQRRPKDYGIKTWIRQVVFELEATAAQEKAFYDFAFAQEKKPYDKLAIADFLFRRDWRDDEAWFCSELLLATTEVASLCPKLYLPNNRFNPTGAACIYSALGGRVV